METQKQTSPAEGTKTIKSYLKVYVAVGMGAIMILGGVVIASTGDINATIGQIRSNSKRWEELEKEQTTLHEANDELKAVCDKQAIEKWGEDSACPLKKN